MESPFIRSIRENIRLRGYSLRTEKTYIHWIRRYIYFINKRHPKDAGPKEVEAFLSWLANHQHVAVNTQKVALNALVYLYTKILNQPLGKMGFSLANKQRVLPVVLSTLEIMSIIQQLKGRNRLVIQLLYGSDSTSTAR